jgi:uncharacterized protein (DUF58 family)
MSSSPRRNPEAVLRRLEWTVIRRLDGLLHGDYRTLFRGFGLDLADIREYQYGDDVRHIDWNVTARLQEPYVREYHEDREVTAWFLLDLSRSIDFGSQVKKGSVSEEFVAVLARLLTSHGNRVGAMLYGDDVEAVIPPRSGRRHVLHILHRMSGRRETPEGRGTDLEAFFRAAMRTLKRRSLVFIVSDFIAAPGWERPLLQLAQRHEVIAVRLHDALESELPDLGLVVFQDAETGEQLFVDTHDQAFRERFARVAAQHGMQIRQAFAQAGVDALELATDADIVDTVIRFAELRKRRRGGRLHELRVA